MADRISSLSDDVLRHILSFLRTDEAAATGFLSKRWRTLWTTVPVLAYDNLIQPYLRNGKPSYRFERLICATILARDAQQPIRRFSLRYHIYKRKLQRANVDINVWVNTAIKRGIENLDIELDFYVGEYLVTLNSNIFSCRTLVVLKLLEVNLAASSSVELPSLKSLDLERVKFENPQYLMELLCGCPMLEDLRTNWIDFDKWGPFCEGRVKNLPKLVRVHLHLVGMELMDASSTNILFKAMSNVEFLAIEENGVDFDNMVAEFPHLRHLSLSVPYITNSHGVLLMLKHCPKLQSFKLDDLFEDTDDVRGPDFVPYPDGVPECLSTCLTECYFKCYRGTKSELQFAKYILQNSTYLQSMKISRVSHNPLKVLTKLALCPRKSALCEVSFD